MTRFAPLLVAAATAASLILTPLAAVAAPPPELTVSTLTVEQLPNPLGIDRPDPLFGWQIDSPKPGAVQSAFEIEVSTKPDGGETVWESGRVESDKSFDVAYAGAPLDSTTLYYWRVRAWDGDDVASAWSDPATFETSFLDDDEFGGDWIGSTTRPPLTKLNGANWIWYPEGEPANSAPSGTRFFRKAVTIPAGSEIKVAQVQLTADDRFELYANGELVLKSPEVNDAWRASRVADITSFLTPGPNVLAIKGVNVFAGPAGVLGKLHVETVGGEVLDLSTDASWKAANTEQSGWSSLDFDDSGWPAAKIGAGYGSAPWYSGVAAPTPSEPLLRHDFDLTKEVASARAYVSGLGYYKLFLNGNRVGDHELDPGFTQYDKTTLYATYDVTEALQNGENAVAVSLGRGYFGQLQPDEWLQSPWHDEPKLKLELDVVYTDGSTDTITSGTHWLSADGPTVSESVWFGETYDARLEKAGWTAPGFDDSSWRPAMRVDSPGGELRSQLFPAIKVTGELPVTGVTHPATGSSVYDFGVPTAGWADIEVEGPAGATVKVVYGEKLHSNGNVNNDNVFFTVQNYSYTLKGGGRESFEPSYSYAGFRYVQVTAPASVTVHSVTGKRVHTDVERVGGFSSSSELLNAYQDAQAETLLNNLHSIPTDTPMYEKRAYTADAFLSSDSAIANFDMQGFYESWLRTHRDDQSPNGTFGNTVPGTVGSKATTDPVWSASYVLMSWDLYWFYGNTRVLSENYEGLKRWMDYYEENIAGTGGIYTGFSYADWLSPAGAAAPEGTKLTATAYLYKAATTMSQIATALDKGSDAAHFDELATRIAESFNETFYDAGEGAYFDKREAGYRQTSNLLPLSFGMVPEDAKATVFGNLVEDIRTRGNHLNTGAIGTKELLPVLTENGEAELAYAVATNPTYPGWGYWFEELGATTMWEEWGANSRSHNHAFLGTVVDWLYQDVAGIEPAAPGYRTVRIQPRATAGLSQAEGFVDSPFGTIRSSWTSTEDAFTLAATVPVGVTAEVYVPVREGDQVTVTPSIATAPLEISGGYARFTVGSGSYTFVASEAPPAVVAVAVSPSPAEPDGEQGWYTDAVAISATGTSSVAGAVTVEYAVGTGGFGPLPADFTLAVEGTSVLHFRAVDALGNLSPVEDVTLKIDTEAPVSSASVDEGARTVTVRSADATSGVSLSQVNIDGAGWIAYTGPVKVGDAESRVQLRAIDKAGNVESAGTAVVPKAGVTLADTLTAANIVDGSVRYLDTNAVTVRVAGSGGVPTGRVQVVQGATLVGTATLNAQGRATVSLNRRLLLPGSHTLSVRYAGDAVFAASEDRVALRVSKAKAKVKASFVDRTIKRKTTPKLKVSVSSKAPVTGKLTVKEGKKTLKAKVTVVKGKATIRLPKLKKGTHKIVVYYAGSATIDAAKTAKIKIYVR